MLLYLIHYNHPNKTQYDIEEVDGEMQKDLIKLIESRNKNIKDKLTDIIEYIKKTNCNLFEITDYCINQNYYEVLKQNQYLITKLIQERTFKKL